jgi:NAD(P)-dependent dehydrogenase (short-subunit alcohol dehydrogenase family)
MLVSLADRHVLVTGASRGIGRAIARACAGAGARVAVHYRQGRQAAEELAAELGGGARAFQADLGDPREPGRLWDEVVAAFGGLDVLVNNAGSAELAGSRSGTARRR